MPFKDLRAFIELLDRRGQLIRIAAPVSAELEITEITDRVSKLPADQNRALLFEHVLRTGDESASPAEYGVPVLINAFGSAERMAWALGVENLDELAARLGRLIDPRLPKGMGEALGRGQDLLGALKGVGLRPHMVRH